MTPIASSACHQPESHILHVDREQVAAKTIGSVKDGPLWQRVSFSTYCDDSRYRYFDCRTLERTRSAITGTSF